MRALRKVAIVAGLALVAAASVAIAQTAGTGAAAPGPAPAAVVDTGTYAGQALTWVVTTFGGTVGAALTALLLRYLKNAGIQGADLLRSRLQEIIVNGLNMAAADAAKRLEGRGKVEIKNEAVGQAVRYAQVHGADILKQLGQDPMAQTTVDAIKARIETVIVDPATPTNPSLAAAPAPKPDQQASKG